MARYDDLFIELRNFIFNLPIWAANYRDNNEGGHRRDISPKLIYHKFQEEWLFCCLLLFEELFKRLLIPSLSQSFTFSRNELSLETLYETVLMMIRKIFRHKQTIKSEVMINENWLSSRNKTSYVQCIWRRSASLDVEVYVSLLLNLKNTKPFHKYVLHHKSVLSQGMGLYHVHWMFSYFKHQDALDILNVTFRIIISLFFHSKVFSSKFS